MDEVLRAPDDGKLRHELFPQIRRNLLAHARAEEQEFYAPLRGFTDTEPLVARSLEQHRGIEQLLAQLASEGAGTPRWLETFGRLRAAVEAHVELEERDLFPLAARVLGREQTKVMDDRYRAVEGIERSRA
jgi:hemerythrin superfamily protein